MCIRWAVATNVLPFYEDQAAIDSARLAMLRHAIFGAPAPPPLPKPPDRVTFAQLRTAAPFDAKVFRAFWRVMGMISQPAEVYTDPEVVARTHATLHEHDSDPSIVQPRRDDWLAALNNDHAGLQAW